METRKIINYGMWVFALLIINIIWANVSNNVASQELNDIDYEFQANREVLLQPVFGSEADLPVEIQSEFVHADNASKIEAVSWKLIDEDGTVVLSWSGQTNEFVSIEADLPPGDYRLETTIGENILATQTLDVAPFAPIAIWGHLILSILLVAVAFGEVGIRKFVSKYNEKTVVKEDKPREFRKTRVGMPEADEANDSPWRDPIT
ncbi:MAG: hypothetical protein HOJ55_01275 [Euryarchaeota archaeon]|jgi:hypothetical protein|nr:hypothetical protein [Euryarchaeota archaeon]MBT5592462.1 hypothetical protein [Euryarchaeota archaeon]